MEKLYITESTQTGSNFMAVVDFDFIRCAMEQARKPAQGCNGNISTWNKNHWPVGLWSGVSDLAVCGKHVRGIPCVWSAEGKNKTALRKNVFVRYPYPWRKLPRRQGKSHLGTLIMMGGKNRGNGEGAWIISAVGLWGLAEAEAPGKAISLSLPLVWWGVRLLK